MSIWQIVLVTYVALWALTMHLWRRRSRELLADIASLEKDEVWMLVISLILAPAIEVVGLIAEIIQPRARARPTVSVIEAGNVSNISDEDLG